MVYDETEIASNRMWFGISPIRNTAIVEQKKRKVCELQDIWNTCRE